MIDIASLTLQRQLTGTVRQVQHAQGLPCLLIQRPECEAVVSLYGGHLLHFTPRGQAPWLWLSQDALLDGQHAIRGGIPVCWPWFGPSPERVGAGKPQHGFARNKTWQLDGISEDADSTLIHLSLSDDAETRALWPFAFELQLDIKVGRELTLQLTCCNTGDQPFTYSGALHTYFNIAEVSQVSLAGLPHNYLDKLAHFAPVNSDHFALDRAMDRVYLQEDARLSLSTGHQTLQLEHRHSNASVVWNPWQEGAAKMGDFDDAGWQHMLCVEPAITEDAPITVLPDEEHSLSVTMRA